MKVDFNNLRFQAANTLDKLIKKLNSAIQNETVHHGFYNENDKFISVFGDLLIDKDDIQKEMEELRSLIMSICFVHEPNNEEFKDLSEQIESTGGVAHFNDLDDENS